MNKRKNDIIIITGPTASGKSSVAVELAKKMGTEIISCDSMQVYKKMDIGTAKVTESEMKGIKHHLIDFVFPNESFNVSDFKKNSMKIIDSLHQEKKIPIITGGTGLYLDSIVYDMDFSKTSPKNVIRAKYEKISREKGNEALYRIYIEKIKEKKFEDKIADPKNSARLIRALEVIDSGNNLSTFKEMKVSKKYNFHIFVLNLDRKHLYDKINYRVDIMLKLGLVEEVSQILSVYGKDCDGMKAIGYKEILDHLINDTNIEESIELLKRNSRRYAKRQLTWFRRYDFANWINVENKSAEDIAHDIYHKCVEI